MARSCIGAFAFSALAVFGLSLAASAAPSLPDTPVGQRMQAWLTAFNSGDPAKLRAYIKKYDPKRIGDLNGELSFRTMTGGFDLRKIEISTPTKLVVLIQERDSDSFARFMMQLSSSPPYRLVHGFIMPTERPAEFALPHLSQEALVAQLKAYLQRAVAGGRFAGVVLVAKDGTPVFEHAYGLADRERKTPDTVDTKFRIGSMNKMFTATAIMQLVQEGKIDLDKPFGTYLPQYPNRSVSGAVTIRELLTHTGGTGDIFTPDYFKNRLNIRTLQDYIALFGGRRLLFKPGTKYEYSNYGFIILGRVIEVVSGQGYYTYVHDHIFAPARMDSTGSLPEDATVPNRSVGYTMMSGPELQPNTNTLPYRGSSAGGGYSTAGDLLKFANALQAHKLLDSRYTQMMISGKVSMGMPGAKYGFGFGDRIVNGIECFGHNGGAPGMYGDLDFCPSDGYTVIVLSNLDPPAGSVADFIENRLPK